MKFCTFSLDIKGKQITSKTEREKKSQNLYQIIQECFEQITEDEFKEHIKLRGDHLSVICPSNNIIGHFSLAGLPSCYLSKEISNKGNLIAIDVFLFIDNMDIEEGIEKCIGFIRNQIKPVKLQIEENVKSLKIYLMDHQQILTSQCRIISKYKKEPILKTRKIWLIICIIGAIVLFTSIALVKNQSYISKIMQEEQSASTQTEKENPPNKIYDVIITLFITLGLEIVNLFVNREKKWTMDLDNIIDIDNNVDLQYKGKPLENPAQHMGD